MASGHFYTRLVQLAALEQGSQLAFAMKDSGAGQFYLRQAQALTRILIQDHWITTDQIFIPQHVGIQNLIHSKESNETTLRPPKSGLDSAILCGILHVWNWQKVDSQLRKKKKENSPWSLPDLTLTPNSGLAYFAGDQDPVVQSVHEILKKNQNLFPINSLKGSKSHPIGMAIGRYMEDVYDGIGISSGNPWILLTLYMAEYFYLLVILVFSHPLPVSPSLQNLLLYLNQLYGPHPLPSLSSSFPIQSKSHIQVCRFLKVMGDIFVNRVEFHFHENPLGTFLPEQIHKETGKWRGALNLTWSSAAFISTCTGQRLATSLLNHVPKDETQNDEKREGKEKMESWEEEKLVEVDFGGEL